LGHNPELDRTVGSLTNRSVTQVDGKPAFRCQCRCGRWRDVLADSFNTGWVTACRECTAMGLKPDRPVTTPPRVQVSLDGDTLALLGVDLTLPENRSGALIRSLLREYGQVVGDESDLGFTEQQWEKMRQDVLNNPDLLEFGPDPTMMVARLLNRSGMGAIPTPPASVVLSALRWAVQHPETERWWEPDTRTGGVQ
jgi:hypothetical protein